MLPSPLPKSSLLQVRLRWVQLCPSPTGLCARSSASHPFPIPQRCGPRCPFAPFFSPPPFLPSSTNWSQMTAIRGVCRKKKREKAEGGRGRGGTPVPIPFCAALLRPEPALLRLLAAIRVFLAERRRNVFQFEFLGKRRPGKIPSIPPAPCSQIYAHGLRLGWAAAAAAAALGRGARWWGGEGGNDGMDPIGSPRPPAPRSGFLSLEAAGVRDAPPNPTGSIVQPGPPSPPVGWCSKAFIAGGVL